MTSLPNPARNQKVSVSYLSTPGNTTLCMTESAILSSWNIWAPTGTQRDHIPLWKTLWDAPLWSSALWRAWLRLLGQYYKDTWISNISDTYHVGRLVNTYWALNCIRYYAKCPTSIISFNSPGNSSRWLWFGYPHYTNGKSEAGLDEVPCPDARAGKQWRQCTPRHQKPLPTNTSSLESNQQRVTGTALSWTDGDIEAQEGLVIWQNSKMFSETVQKLELGPPDHQSVALLSTLHCLSNSIQGISCW